jgi:amidase
MGSVEPAWKPKAIKKREAQLASIPKRWRLPEPLPKPKNTYDYLKKSGVLTEDELEITETTDATILLRKMASGALSAVQVASAFAKRAAIAQQLIRCCTEMFFDEALATAEYLDDYFEKHKRVIGPLHGLPVSLKDGFNIVGQDTTLG